MRIAVASPVDYPCGIALHTETLARAWEAAGHEVWFLGEEAENPDWYRGEYPAERVVRCWRRGGNLLEMVREARRIKPDVINVHHEFAFCKSPGQWEELLEALRGVAPVVVTYHSWPAHRDPLTRNRIPDHVVLANHNAVESALSDGFFPENVSFVEHPIDAVPWEPHPESEPVAPRIVTWGIPYPGKGLSLVLEAMENLIRLRPDARLTISLAVRPHAEDEDRRYIETRVLPEIRARGLADSVDVLQGWVAGSQLQTMLRAHSIAWLHYEPHRSILASSACLRSAWEVGLPAVTSDASQFDLPDDPEHRGLCIQAGTAKRIAEETAGLLGDPAWYGQMQTAIREHGQRRPAETVGREYLAIFDRARSRYTPPKRRIQRLRLAVALSQDTRSVFGTRAWLAASALMDVADVRLIVRDLGDPAACDAAVIFNCDHDKGVLAIMSEQRKPTVYCLDPGAIRSGGFLDENCHTPHFRADRRFKMRFATFVQTDTEEQARMAARHYGFNARWLPVPPGPEVEGTPRNRSGARAVLVIGDVPGVFDWAKEHGLECYTYEDEYHLLNEASRRNDVIAVWERPSYFGERLLAVASTGTPLAVCRSGILPETPAAEWYDVEWQPAAEALLEWTGPRVSQQVAAANEHTWQSWAETVVQALCDEL